MARDIWWDIENRFEDLRRSLRDFEPYRTLESGRRAPAVDVLDQGRAFVITADVPGMDRDDIDIAVDTRSVTIHAAHGEAEEDAPERGYVRRERSYRSFERRLPLPDAVQPDAATARYKNGVLTVTVPKREPTDDETRHITPE